MEDVKEALTILGVIIVALVVMFFVGRCSVDVTHEVVEKSDTITRTDTVKIPDPQLVTQEVVRYKYVPVAIDVAPDTIIQRDTVIQVQDGVAVIPISMKTYTDSSTYKAVVSGYDPRLESIEVYQKTTTITNTVKARPWSFGVQGGVYMTPAGVQPGIGIGLNYRLSL